ncbi:restriction endonuclease subunit M [Aeromicrobium flavum]|uniref:site-specific DNA-methyltransferase (adenine-specific) n=1 Tax=Aeromicrobium flavum TaxID=416568 RepID=A0A512HVR3_9ACTN|nr:restriction endonuclease subunit M [Aeromicrobium flavum]
MSSDAIIVGEEWISEHYFTTDATKESFKARVLARRTAWDALKDQGTPRTRFTAARSSLLNRFATLDAHDDRVAAVRALNADVRALLGFDGIGFTSKVQGPVTFLSAAGLDHTAGLAIIDACPAETIEHLLAKDEDNLTEAFLPADVGPTADDTGVHKDAVTSVARLLSLLFLHDDFKPAFALVLAGPHVLVAERERWPEGRYLAVDLQLVAERNDDKKGGEVDRALACLASDSLAPDAQGDIWWTDTLSESVKHTVGVSKDLREGVRLSIEIIANEVVARRKAGSLDPLPSAEAQPLAKQSLRFLYRILFLLYAEASPELGVLPAGAPEYENGYSLDRLRELILVDLPTRNSQAGTHLYESLGALFRLVDRGHDPSRHDQAEGEYVDGLTFRSLRADLFKPEATAHIDEVGLGNAALQRVLRHLLLSKEQRGRDRGFISYAELGINQLGAVYEGLMSYTGFFAETDLYEVAKDGKSEKGSWVVPVAGAEGIAEKDFVTVEDKYGERKPVLHPQGSFVFRLAGRERQQSASYYTPEVLTRFVVSQALEELLDQDGQRTTAAEILELTICEPALGSGAFAIEAVRQFAEQYLKRRQEELDESVDPDAYPRELQRVKAYLALHQTYGVDLNATAVELAEISLWLDTMVEGLEAPWFGLHLRRGNSLIGARKAVYSRSTVEDKSWLKAVPKPVKPGTNDMDHVDRIDGRIPHFLLPAEGWGAAADVGKDIKELVPEAVADLKKWRRSMHAKPGKKQVDALVALGRRVERLWDIAGHRLAIAEQQIRRDIPLWGAPETEGEGEGPSLGRHVSREEIEESLADPDGAYRRLRLVMDAWCAFWFWPLTEEEVAPPTLEQWYDALRMILGADTMRVSTARKGQDTLESALIWDDLGDFEYNDRVFADASRIDAVLNKHPWLRVCQAVADQQGFFHWQLDFVSVFDRGGFDLQVGNPPWVRPDWDAAAALGEYDVRFALEGKMTVARARDLADQALSDTSARNEYVGLAGDQLAVRESVSDPTLFPHLQGLRPDLYRCFMEQTWDHRAPHGVTVLLHPETHFTDEKAGTLRAATYRRLRRHWQFINELGLFDIHNLVTYGVHVYGAVRAEPKFLMATSLYAPETVIRSLTHDGAGEQPGLKDPDGSWDLRPHRGRILEVGVDMLATWHSMLEDSQVPVLQTRMIYAVNSASARVLRVISESTRMQDLVLQFSGGWNETTDYKKGRFSLEWGPVGSWAEVILQGPHVHVGNPFYKFPNPSMSSNKDWASVDLEALGAGAIPVTSFKIRGDFARYDAAYNHWDDAAARDTYRLAWRKMAATTGERTLIPALIPPGAAHIHGMLSLAVAGGALRSLSLLAGFASSLVNDFALRATGKANLYASSIERLVLTKGHPLESYLILRVLRLNCLSEAYAELWEDFSRDGVTADDWLGGINFPGRRALSDVTPTWTEGVPLRRSSDRRQALVELDALVALMVGLSPDDLSTIYRTQFPVLYGYDRNKYLYDINGREVPTPIVQLWRKEGLDETSVDGLTADERTHTNASGNTYVYELPFITLDREADMRQAYTHFERVLAERTAHE